MIASPTILTNIRPKRTRKQTALFSDEYELYYQKPAVAAALCRKAATCVKASTMNSSNTTTSSSTAPSSTAVEDDELIIVEKNDIVVEDDELFVDVSNYDIVVEDDELFIDENNDIVIEGDEKKENTTKNDANAIHSDSDINGHQRRRKTVRFIDEIPGHSLTTVHYYVPYSATPVHFLSSIVHFLSSIGTVNFWPSITKVVEQAQQQQQMPTVMHVVSLPFFVIAFPVSIDILFDAVHG
jgi:hypothetical protein